MNPLNALLLRPTRLAVLLLAITPAVSRAQETAELSPLVVTATRTPRRAADLPVTIDVISRQEFAASPAFAVDDVLRTSAAFSLFRRNGSLMANPTTQGVSLRNIGPSAAGRTLVLVDGVPLNDPFGGWVAWTKVPRLVIAQAEIVRGGGSSAWGSAALGGTIQLFSEPTGAPGSHRLDTPSAQLLLEAGDFATRSAEFLAHAARGEHRVHVTGRTFRTNGFWRVAAADRGAIDRRTDSDHQLVQLGWEHGGGDQPALELTARLFREDRGNGTPVQRNASEEAFLSGRAAGRWSPDLEWTFTSYAQKQDFANQFSSVASDRTAETPSLDQYGIPAEAAGGAFTTSWRHPSTATTALGADVRWVRAETQEAYFRENNQFTRRRFAGGSQRFVGLFLQHERRLAERWHLTAGGRVDQWENIDGHRRELEAAGGLLLRDERFPRRSGTRFTPSAGLVWHAREHLRLRGAAYRAFRVPTLNELYRPFRVGNVVTEANPQLAVERLDGIEVGADGRIGRASWTLTGFVNELQDLVANVTVGRGPATLPEVGFVPAGVVARQKRNLDRAVVHGLELGVRWTLPRALSLRADYLLSDGEVRAASGPAKDLVGRRLAQAPRHTVTAGLDWEPSAHWRLGAAVRHVGEAFEDDANTLTLAAATTLDLRAGYSFGAGQRHETFLSVENALDAAVQSGRDANGRVDLAPPRFVHGGVRWSW